MNEAAVEAGLRELMRYGVSRAIGLYFLIKLAQDNGNNGVAAAAMVKYETEMTPRAASAAMSCAAQIAQL
ncbi:MAG: hypothetical protein WC421_02930 [Elusimicrobiales bacterium]